MVIMKKILLMGLIAVIPVSAFCQKEGVGRYVFPKDGAIYNGELISGKPNGKGKTTFKTGDVYEGEYV